MNKLNYFFYYYSDRITAIFFSIMLIILASIKIFKFPYTEIPPYLAYLFWLSLGLTLGTAWGIEAMKYLNKKKKGQSLTNQEVDKIN